MWVDGVISGGLGMVHGGSKLILIQWGVARQCSLGSCSLPPASALQANPPCPVARLPPCSEVNMPWAKAWGATDAKGKFKYRFPPTVFYEMAVSEAGQGSAVLRSVHQLLCKLERATHSHRTVQAVPAPRVA